MVVVRDGGLSVSKKICLARGRAAGPDGEWVDGPKIVLAPEAL